MCTSNSGCPPKVVPAPRSTASTVKSPKRPARQSSSSNGRQAWGQAMQRAGQEQQWRHLLEHLPENVRQIWHALGGHEKGRMQDLWRILQAYGGQSLCIPSTLPAQRHHPLRRRLGARCTAKLVAAFGGTPLYVPSCARVLTKLRQRNIIELFTRETTRGLSSTAAVGNLARKHGLSDRQVWNILKKTASAPAQGRLLHDLQTPDMHAKNTHNSMFSIELSHGVRACAKYTLFQTIINTIQVRQSTKDH